MAWDTKTVLVTYLQRAREAVVWKLEGLTESQARWPWTPTGTNLLGTLKHAASIEIAYFGDCFGRPWPGEALPWLSDDAADHADSWATETESLPYLIDLARRVWRFADDTIASYELDTVTTVAWWPQETREVTLAQIITHVTSDLNRHGGHSDLMREYTDGAVGHRPDRSNMADLTAVQWEAHVTELKRLARSVK